MAICRHNESRPWLPQGRGRDRLARAGEGTVRREKTTVNFLRALIAAALLTAAAFSASAQPAAQKLVPLKVAYDGYSMTTAPMNYAVQKGIFKKYGLDVTLAYIDAGTTLSQA